VTGLPGGWVETNLGSICSFENGDRGINYPGRKAFVSSGVPFINAGHLESGIIDWSTMDFISKERFELLSKGKIQEDDILFCLRGSLGKFGIVDFSTIGAIASSLIIIRKSDAIDLNFLKFYFLSNHSKNEIDRYANGNAQPNLSGKSLNAFQIPLPPLPEQRRIAEALDRHFARTRQARDDLARIPTLIRHYREAVLNQVFSFENIELWSKYMLKDLLKDDLLGLVRSKVDQNDCSGFPYIRMNHFDLSGEWNERNLTFVEANRHEVERYKLVKNDILFNTRNSLELVGKVAIWLSDEGDYLYNNNLLRLRFCKDVEPEFAFFYMISTCFRNYLDSIKSATTSVAAIYQKNLYAAPFYVPPSEEQRNIVQHLKKANQWLAVVEAEHAKAMELLDHMDQALLAKAFCGELVPQDPSDEPASALLERVRAERASQPKPKRGRGKEGGLERCYG
jgi:type I restriction enzyme S subunit